MHAILDPWPWYVGGPLIAMIMFLLIFMGKRFGMSSNLRTMCTMCGAGKHASFFDFDWKESSWNLVFVAGTILGGFLAAHYLSSDTAIVLAPSVIADLQQKGFASAGTAYVPTELFAPAALGNFGSLSMLIIGGFMVGFGARYAGGCTSGHAISGLSNLQAPSLVAVIGFFLGGMIMIHICFPIIFGQ